MEKKRDYSLDFIKIIATILIVFHHYQQVVGGHFRYIDFFGGKFYYGYVVELFFILFGYFMFKYISKIKNGLSFKDFFKQRYLRFLPIMALTSIVYSICLYIYTNVLNLSWFNYKFSLWGTISSSLGLAEGWGMKNPFINYPNWYISVLLICFVVFYLMVYISKKKNISEIILFAFVIFLGFAISNYEINFLFMTSQVARGYYAFFFGVILAIILNNKSPNLLIQILSAVIVIVVPIIIHYNTSILPNDVNYFMTFIYYPALIIIFKFKFINKLFRVKFIEVVSNITFDVYLWHNVLLLMGSLFLNIFKINVKLDSFVAMLCYTAISFLVGTLSYYLIDKPIKNLIVKKRLIAK